MNQTEIAALRLEIAKACDNWIPEIKIHPKLLEKVLNKLEAERQRAAGSEEELHKALHREKAEGSKLLAAQEEIAALKPEINWPVAQKVRAALDRAACPDAFMRIAVEACTVALKGEQVPVAYSGWAVQYRENTLPKLFGALEIAALNCYEELGNKLLFLSTAPQKPVISKEKLCDWLEDNFDIDDSQRDAFANCFSHHCNCIVKEVE